MVYQLAITLGAWVVLMFVTTNLVGLLVRGFYSSPKMDQLATESEPIVQELAQDHQRGQTRANVIALVLICAFLFALYYFWNVGLVVAALMMMASRVPDLIWELNNGRKLEVRDVRRPALWRLTTVLSWVSLPVIWYALYRM